MLVETLCCNPCTHACVCVSAVHEVWERGEILQLSNVRVVEATFGCPTVATRRDATQKVKERANGCNLVIDPVEGGNSFLRAWMGGEVTGCSGKTKSLRITVTDCVGVCVCVCVCVCVYVCVVSQIVK